MKNKKVKKKGLEVDQFEVLTNEISFALHAPTYIPPTRFTFSFFNYNYNYLRKKIEEEEEEVTYAT